MGLRCWLARRGTGTLFVEPRNPWENAYVESFNSRLRDELLDRELFTSLLEARVLLEEHRMKYGHPSARQAERCTGHRRLRDDSSR